MEENNTVVNELQSETEKPSLGSRISASLKEWLRKNVVNLKRRPQKIAFFVLIISTLVNLCILGSLSQLGMEPEYSREMQGLCIFVNQLFGILVLLLFMNSFPKRAKKPNIIMLVLTFVFMAVLIGLDCYLNVMWNKNYAADLLRTSETSYWENINAFYPQAQSGLIAHIVLVGLSAVLTATYPLYGKLINKINTRKVVESTELKEAIDTSEE